MLDKLLETLVSAARRQLKRPVLLFSFTPEKQGFSTRFTGSDDVTMHHVVGAATDLLRMAEEQVADDSTCPCCLARKLRVATALAALTDGEGARAPALH